MGKEKIAKKSNHAPVRAPTVQVLRSKIDRLDQELLKLMNERAKIALQIGKRKSQAGHTAYAPAREEEVVSRVLTLNKGPLSERCVRAVFRELISGSRALEKELRVA